MPNYAKNLDKASSTFFFFGFAISQLRFAPFVISAFAKISSLFFYLIAYVLWLAASHLYPDHPRLRREWYGFAQFKNQHRIAAALGTLAVICSIITFVFPIIAVPASWLFVISNVFWLISEYHKKQNPPDEEDYSSERQHIYLIYASLITSMAIITAVATTIIAFYPIATIATILLASLFSICLGTVAFKYWAEYTFFDYQMDSVNASYKLFLSNELGQNSENQPGLQRIELNNYPSPISTPEHSKKHRQPEPTSPTEHTLRLFD